MVDKTNAPLSRRLSLQGFPHGAHMSTWIAPWEVPNWEVHVTFMGVVAPYIRKAWICDLTIVYKGLSILLIHMAAKLVTQTFEEPTVVGGAADTFSVVGSMWTISSELTWFDADTVAIAKVVRSLDSILH